MNKNDSYQMSYLMRVAAGVFLVACAASFMSLVPYLRDEYGSGKRKREALKAIEAELAAIAQLENEQGDEAANAFARLAKANPDLGSHWVNLAVARLVAYENVLAISNDPAKSESPDLARLQQLRSEAEEAVQKAIDESADTVEPLLIKQKLYEKLVLEDQSLSSKLSAELLAEIRAKLEQFPDDARLASAFDTQIESQSSSQPDLVERSIDMLYACWKANPRNLFLAERVARRLAQLGDSRFTELLEYLVSISGPFNWEEGFKGEDNLTARLKSAIASNDADEIDSVGNSWLNELKRTSAFASDRRNTDLDRLAFIDFSNVAKAREERTKRQQRRSGEFGVSFTPWEGGEKLIANSGAATTVDCVDWDNDLRPELISIVDGYLKIERLVTSGSDPLASELLVDVATMPDAVGVVCVGLSSARDRSGTKVAPDISDAPGLDNESVDGSNVLRPRTQAICDVIVYGPSGIEVFNFVNALPADSATNETESDGATDIGKKLVDDSNLIFKRIQNDSQLNQLKNVTDVQPLDWDSDGDLDLAILAGSNLTMWLNMGDKKLRRFDEAIGSTLDERTTSAAKNVRAVRAIDFDRDLDVDLIATLNDGRTVGVFENLQHSQFRFRQFNSDWNDLAGAASLQAVEIDGNASWDWIGGKPNRIGCVFTMTPSPGQTLLRGRISMEFPVQQFTLADLDNSGQLEVVVASQRGISVVHVRAPREGQRASIYDSELPVGQVLAKDIDRDGDPDLIVSRGQEVVVLRNDGDS